MTVVAVVPASKTTRLQRELAARMRAAVGGEGRRVRSMAEGDREQGTRREVRNADQTHEWWT